MAGDVNLQFVKGLPKELPQGAYALTLQDMQRLLGKPTLYETLLIFLGSWCDAKLKQAVGKRIKKALLRDPAMMAEIATKSSELQAKHSAPVEQTPPPVQPKKTKAKK